MRPILLTQAYGFSRSSSFRELTPRSSGGVAFGLLAGFLLALTGCESSDSGDDKPPAEICDNLEDDDLDELADCADPDCAPVCGEVCTNGTDDDLDGLIDCLDDDCDGLCPENCGDGRDNDADGAIDCDDRDCFGSCPEVCGDGFDNDGDGKVDCLDEECVDPSCPEVCSDGRDNDADALVDCADEDCNDPACDEACADGRDNDADGRVDCDDSDCDGDCPEVCDDGRDNDADGRVDCDDPECEVVCDADGDGFFNADFGGDDCDDTRADVNPSRPEICNGEEVLDDDCDGLFDEDDPDVDVFTLIAWGPDADGDGFGTDRDVQFACQQPDGWGFANRDCDDTRADINPAMPEICNPDAPVDDDCDGLIDDDDPDVSEDSYLEWYADRDDDGFGSGVDFEYGCSRPEGTAPRNDDCDDADPTVGPPSLWYPDTDRDGFGAGDPVDPTPTCDPPGPGLRPDWIGLDCDDGEARIFPGADEVCEDGIDQDCDGEDRSCRPDCDPVDEVEWSDTCLYLDGSGGACLPGYTLAPQVALEDVAGDFVGKDYKTMVSGNCCIWHRDQDIELQDWGMSADCNAPGPLGEGPIAGGAGCLDVLNLGPTQLTLCMVDVD